MDSSKKTYKILHYYTKPEYRKKCRKFIKTLMPAEKLEKIYAGLQLYLEENTKYGELGYLTVTEDIFAGFLREFYGCEIAPNSDETEYDDEIDIYYARESNLPEKPGEYLKDYLNTGFVRKLEAYFNDPECDADDEIIRVLTLDEIMRKY